MPAPRRSFLILGSVLTLALITLLSGPRRQPSANAPDALGGLLAIDNYSLGEILEGAGPAIERFPPGALPAAPQVAAQEPLPAPVEGSPVDFRHYPSPEEIRAFLQDLAAAHPDLVTVQTIGHSWQGRPIDAVRLTNARAPQPIADRPVILIDAQHHARELVSAQVALYNVWRLVDGYGKDPVATRILDTRVVHVIPSVNVDGNALVLADNQNNRKTLSPACCDDDGDGKVDEDPPLSYGYGTDSLSRYTFDQAWADAHPQDPFVDDWRGHVIGQPQALGRFTGALGGERRAIARVDADGDGRIQEDPLGGVDPNRNYDWFWEGGDARIGSDAFRGPAAWSEPEVRTLRDYVAELGTIAASVSYHSGTDLLLHPWAYSESDPLPDEGIYELLGAKGSQLTAVHGFPGTVRTWTARGLYVAMGSSMDYIYAKMGALAFAPETFGDSGITRIERLGATGTYTVGQATGFSFNPRPEGILPVADRWDRWARYLMAASPNIALNALRRDGDALLIAIGSEGVMPIRLRVTLTAADGRRLELAPEGDRVVHAEQLRWRVPLTALGAQGNRLEAEAILASGTRPHRVELARWSFDLDPAGPRLTVGGIEPFTDLSAHFGGWWAGPEWNDPRYRCSKEPCQPQILVTPPPLPTVAAEPTEAPALSPTASPTGAPELVLPLLRAP